MIVRKEESPIGGERYVRGALERWTVRAEAADEVAPVLGGHVRGRIGPREDQTRPGPGRVRVEAAVQGHEDGAAVRLGPQVVLPVEAERGVAEDELGVLQRRRRAGARRRDGDGRA